MAHLDDTTIALFIEQRLTPPRVDELQHHIDSCDACRQLVAQLAKSDSVLAKGSTIGAPPARERQTVERGDKIGRYVVLDLVGSGAMGAVYAALDADLDRKVAVKLLHRGAAASEAERARMLREAQALARVADRGVVAVHDVGTHDEQIYIAMEFVTGGTLKAWLAQEPRTWRQILAVALAAGRGLAAAHDAGLIHRDVKPDNILVDEKGVARIGDFGLAAGIGDALQRSSEAHGLPSSGSFSAELTASGMMVGTPAYMAPEQLAGGTVTPQSDQFSFCVTVFESLFGKRPFVGMTLDEIRRAMQSPVVFPDKPRVPAHVRKALVRALAVEPGRRFPSMMALLGALDPAPRRRRVFAAVAVTAGAAALITSVAVARTTVAKAEPCLDGARKLTGVWDAPRKAEIKKAFLATGVPYAADAWRGVEQSLDRFSSSWVKMHRSTCEATRVHGDQTEQVLNLRMWCLDERLRDTQVLTESLRAADRTIVTRAVPAADRLPSVDMCADAQALSQKLPPRDAAARETIERVRADLSQVKTLSLLGKLEESHALVTKVSAAAAKADYPPLEAEVLIEQARIGFMLEGDAKAAEQMLLRASWAADRGRDDHLRARAWNLQYYMVGLAQQRFDEAAKIYEHASASLKRLVGAEGLEAQLLGNHGQVLTVQAKFDEATATLLRSLALLEKTVGPDHFETGNALAALANVYLHTNDTEKSLAFAQRAYDVQVRAVGPKHPESAKSMFSIGIALEELGRYDESADKFAQVIATLEAALGKDHLDLAVTIDELGVVRRKQHKLDESLALHQRALALREAKLGQEHNETAVSLDNVGLVLLLLERGKEALPYHQRALAITEKAFGADHPETAASHGYLANVYLSLDRPKEAIAEFRHALAVTEKALGKDSFDLAFYLSGIGYALLDLRKPADAIEPLERSLRLRGATGDPMSTAEVKFGLARALWDTRRDRARAQELAEAARPQYKAAGLNDVETWLAARR